MIIVRDDNGMAAGLRHHTESGDVLEWSPDKPHECVINGMEHQDAELHKESLTMLEDLRLNLERGNSPLPFAGTPSWFEGVATIYAWAWTLDYCRLDNINREYNADLLKRAAEPTSQFRTPRDNQRIQVLERKLKQEREKVAAFEAVLSKINRLHGSFSLTMNEYLDEYTNIPF